MKARHVIALFGVILSMWVWYAIGVELHDAGYRFAVLLAAYSFVGCAFGLGAWAFSKSEAK